VIQGFWASRAISVAAELGIPDLLKNGLIALEPGASRVSRSRTIVQAWEKNSANR
jgi:hypothetical protein